MTLPFNKIKQIDLFYILILISPMFVLTVKHWINIIVIVLFCGSIKFLINNKKNLIFDKKRLIILLILTNPLFSVAIGQILRGEIYLPNYDSPLRLFLCSIIFLSISNGWLINNKQIVYKWMVYYFPMSIIVTIIFQNTWTVSWGDYRITTYFVDPLSFCSLTLFATIVTFFSFLYFKNNILKIIHFIILFIGIYLTIMSGSRTGWASLPFILLYLNYFIFNNKIKVIHQLIYIIIFFTFILFISYFVQPMLFNKFIQIYTETVNYKFHEMNSDTSVGMRISFYRMGIDYFIQKPFSGWGDTGWVSYIKNTNFDTFASKDTIEFPLMGFHNEILTNTVRSGIFGLVSSIMLFLVPIYISFSLLLNTKNKPIIINCSFVVIFIIHMFITSLSTEITNLVFLSSNFGLILSVSLGEILFLHSRKY
jgi:O-antigen ligase